MKIWGYRFIGHCFFEVPGLLTFEKHCTILGASVNVRAPRSPAVEKLLIFNPRFPKFI